MKNYFFKRKKHLKIVLIFLILSSISVLSGCSGMNSNFDCNQIGGIQSCATLGHVNRMANRGDFDRNADNSASESKNIASPVGVSYTSSDKPVRYGEKLQSVWIAPYVAKDGSYMWASKATIIVRHGAWVGAGSQISKNSDA